MISIPGYLISEQIYSSSKTLIYRGKRLSDGKNVILKLPRPEYPSFQELVQFRHQYSLKKNIHSPYIRDCYDLECYQNRFILVLEDFGGISLSEYINNHNLTLKEFLEIGISLTYILETLAENKIIHKDIKPANLLINPETKQIKLIDFSISSLLPREQQEIESSYVLEGTLAYISPEQTGRMNRGIDYRTDFYSLGVTFYELLTGNLPFSINDPVELVYCHLAKNPPDLTSDKIPQVISNIVLKLMAKMPENRYQTAMGLRYDLQKCLQELETKENITNFILGEKDKCDRFLIPEKIYGRETEINNLLAAFERIADSNSQENKLEMILVSGFSGIGKTSVVKEVHKPIVRQRGYFIKGKFDQYKRNIPLNALVEAFSDLIKQLLTESDEQVKYWQNRLKKALGDNGQVIVDVISDVELLIGKQPPLTELSPTETNNRFHHIFKQFIQVFTTAKYPLVLFIDDLQWIDLASLKLLQLLMTENQGNLLLIGAYRDNEVSPTHPLILALNDLTNDGVIINEINLLPLNKNALNQLIADTLKCDLSQSLPLTELVNQKTNCNPFFATQFLKFLHQEGLIYFDFSQNGWECNLSEIKRLSITENVVDFMGNELQKLPLSTQYLLQLASCIGNQFDLKTLEIVAQKKASEIATCLWKALQNGFILPLNDVYKFYQQADLTVEEIENKLINKCVYRFYHDRIQQAAYSLIPESEKKQTHLKIGQLLLENFGEKEREEEIFEIVNQLNIGQYLITEKKEQILLAELNLQAGQKALNSTAQIAALEYFKTGFNLLTSNSWQTDYKLTLNLTEKLAEAAYFNGDFSLMNTHIEKVLEKAQNTLDKVNIYQLKIQAQIAQNKLQEAIDTAFQFLQPFGIEFPTEFTSETIELGLTKIANKLREKDLDNLTELPLMSDERKLAAMETLGTVSSAAYIGFPNLYPLIILKQIDLSLDYGMSPNSAYAFATYGLILCVFNDIETGYQVGKLALKLLDKYQVTRLKSKVLNLVYPFISPWKKHLKKSLKPLLEGYYSGLQTGDLEFAAYCAYNHCSFNYFAGISLPEVLEKMEIYGQAIAQIKQNTALNFHNIYHQVVLNLLAENIIETPYIWDKKVYHNCNDPFSKSSYFINKLIISYLLNAKKEDIAYYQKKARETIQGVAGYPLFTLFYFYDSLSHIAIYKDKNDLNKTLEKVNYNQEKLKNWSAHCPDNFLHKYYLVEAEKYRLLGDKINAIENYEQGIKLAQENGFIQEEALAFELAAIFYLEWGKDLIAQTYLINAYYAYSQWGSTAKIELLETNYEKLLAPILLQKEQLQPGETLQQITKETLRNTNINRITKSSISKGSSGSNILDLQTVMKASQTISSEIELHKLLSTLMQVIMENVGANHGCLILEQNDKLEVVSQCDDHLGCQLETTPLENSQEAPISIINYVWRTKEILVLNNVESETNFTGDIYITSNGPQSLLCMPILRKTKPLGILYLENNLTKNAFNKDRLELLKILVSQAAISIENAKLYEQLEENTFYDKLTKLPNRLYFINLLKHSIQLAKQDRNYKYAVLFLDLDRFKIINESMGHTIGDELLQIFAQRVKKCLKETNTLARFGGDEFGILLENIDSVYDAVKIAQLIKEKMKQPFILKGEEIFSTVSIGITLSTLNYQKAVNVLRDADIAMYRAKARKNGHYELYDPQMQANIYKRLQLENDLRKGIKNKEFSLFYQPIISLKTNKLVGFEALIRWFHPQKGFISPGEFIPIAEDNGSIIPLGYLVLKEACEQLAFWQKNILKGVNITVNVNLSIKQFSEPNLIENIDNIFRETNLNTNLIKLEITESAIMDNYEKAQKILEKLKERNIQLCIDDFGTGYSSLSYLHQFPLDILKIDRSFIRHITPDSKNLEIVQGIISLAHSLEMKVVAEGVETEKQSHLLKQLNCEFGQGYYFAKPLDKKAATEFIINQGL